MLDKFKEINWDPDKSEVNGFCKTLRGLFGWESHGFLVVVGLGPFRYGLPGWGGLLVWQVSVRTSSVASFTESGFS